jgi:hypothetical protein
MAILRKATVSFLTLAAVGALLLLGGIIFNGTVSAITGSSSDASPDEVNTAHSLTAGSGSSASTLSAIRRSGGAPFDSTRLSRERSSAVSARASAPRPRLQ